MGKVWAAIEVVRDLLKLLKQFFDWLTSIQNKKAQAKLDALNKAVDDSKAAKTDEEIFKTQETIAENKS